MADSVGSVQLDLEFSDQLDDQKLMGAIQGTLDKLQNKFNQFSVKLKPDTSCVEKANVALFSKMKSKIAQMSNHFRQQTSKMKSALDDVSKADFKDIELDTKIKFKQDTIANLKEQAESIQNRINSGNGLASSQLAELDELDIKLDELRSKYQEIIKSNGILGETDASRTLKKELDALIAKQERLVRANVKLENIDLKNLDSQYRKIQATISRLTGETEALHAKQAARSASTASGSIAPVRTKKQDTDIIGGVHKSKGMTGMNRFTKRLARNLFGITLAYRAAARAARSFFSFIGNALSTNDAFNRSLATIKSNLMTAFMPIYNAVLPAINALMSGLATVTGYIAAFIASVFGTTASAAQASGAALQSSMQGATGAMEDYGAAAAEARGQLAGFDQLNDITQETPSGGGGGGVSAPPMIDLSKEQVAIDGMMKAIKSKFKNVSDWAKKNFGSIWDDFVKKAQINLENSKKIANRVWNDIKKLGSPFKNWFDNNLTPFMQALATSFLNQVNRIWNVSNMVFGSLWETVFFPFLQNMFSTWLPMITDIFTNMLTLLDEIYTQVERVFVTLWNEAVIPALSLVMTIWTDLTTYLKEAWDKYGKPIFDELKIAVQGVADTLLSLWQDYVKPIFDLVMNTLRRLWSEAVGPLVRDVIDAVMRIGLTILKFWNEKLKPLIDWLLQKFKPVFDQVFNKVKDIVNGAVNMIVGVINGLRETFNGIVNFITGVFSGNWQQAWDGVVGIFSGIWETIKSVISGAWDFILGLFNFGGKIFVGVVNGIADVFKNIVNSIIKGLNDVISFPFRKVNDILNGIRGVDILGFKPFSWVGTIPVPKIPQLANGGVLTTPQLVMAGEYSGARTNPEIVTPQNIMADTLREVLTELGLNGGNEQLQPINLLLDGNIIYQTVVKIAKQKQRQFGHEVFSL